MPRLLAAPDKYRGTASAHEVARAVAAAAERRGWVATPLPLSDGGEGLLDVFAGRGFELRSERVLGPDGRELCAEWRTDGRLAVVELARASGLSIVGGAADNDAVAATSVGTGQLLAAAVDAVAPRGRVLVGLGGSASTDGGLAAAELVRERGGLGHVELVGACDVHIGFLDAARLFGPQKGATPEQVELLRRRLVDVAHRYRDEFGVDVTEVPGAGAAGGFGGAIVALGGTLRSGYGLVAEEVGLRPALAASDLVVTGEGALDAPSFMGKVVGGVVDDAADVGVPVVVLAGRATPEAREEARRRGARVETLVERFGSERAMAQPLACVADLVDELLATAVVDP